MNCVNLFATFLRQPRRASKERHCARGGFLVWAVVKPKTNEPRMVGNFRVLNKKPVSDEFAISDLLETLESLNCL
jgi:hypothetical protein